jgi:IS30 family transposase
MTANSSVTLNIIKAAMDLAQRDEQLGLVTMDQIQSIQRTRYAPVDRKQLAALLKAEGKSNREIAKEVGVDHETVNRDLRGGANAPKNGPNAPPENDTGSGRRSGNGRSRPHKSAENDESTDADVEQTTEEKIEHDRAALVIYAGTAIDLAEKIISFSDLKHITNEAKETIHRAAVTWAELDAKTRG